VPENRANIINKTKIRKQNDSSGVPTQSQMIASELKKNGTFEVP
jgi:hypothetical protein